MPIVRLVREEYFYVPGLLLVIVGTNSLLASVRTDFELVIELYISERSKYQYQYKVNSQNTKNSN